MSDENDTSIDELSFDAALERLDEVVHRLEDGSVELEEAIRLFEQGTAYVARCRERLTAAQARIEELTATNLPAQEGPPDDADPSEETPF